ncbi:MAG: endonuclease III [Helicobacteraceae bacterium]|jgi:endonuclease-3|nr:endonuclease III [Helicobacteraceae bacterium]
MKPKGFLDVLDIIKANKPHAPVVTLVAESERDPFKVLIATILSLRTKDETTAKAAQRLFEQACDPNQMLRLSHKELERLIYPVGFYRDKARRILEISERIVKDFGGVVPADLDTLLTFSGVGRKTANLVMSLGFDQPSVCVDTHVFRITNRLGFVKAKDPERTEFVLRRKVPMARWSEINDLLVALGQTICKPISPTCSKCPVSESCERRGVKKSG